jgi:ribosomal protein L16 Arg81 hydroxylase
MRQPILPRVLRPVTLRRFADEYFNQTPLFIRGKKTKYQFLFRPEEWDQKLRDVTDIHAIFPGYWKIKISPSAISEMVGAGATICVTGLECAHPKLARAAAQIRRELGFLGEVSFRAYLSPPGGGVDIHYDARVATTLQLSGSKRWWFSANPHHPYPSRNSTRPAGWTATSRPPPIRSLRSVLLRPGDLLCLPAGTWHRARAQTTSLALNLAFDSNRPELLDLVTALVGPTLEKDEAWRRPLPISPGVSTATSYEAALPELRNKISLFAKQLSQLSANEPQLTILLRSLSGR